LRYLSCWSFSRRRSGKITENQKKAEKFFQFQKMFVPLRAITKNEAFTTATRL